MSKRNTPELNLYEAFYYFADKQFKIHCKAINERKTKKRAKGENKWIHPDIVGFKLEENNAENYKFSKSTINLLKLLQKENLTFYSFELKAEKITFAKLKEFYFQAVSNSSWANVGYLVMTTNPDTMDVSLKEEIERLVSSFGIGVIYLDNQYVENSYVWLDATFKETIDLNTINKLTSEDKADNTTFKAFIDAVIACVENKNNFTAYGAIINQEFEKIPQLNSISFTKDKEIDLITSSKLKDIDVDDSLSNISLEDDWTNVNFRVASYKDKTKDISNAASLFEFILEEVFRECGEQPFKAATTLYSQNKAIKRTYFSKKFSDIETMKMPKKIPNSDIFYEANLNNEMKRKIILELLRLSNIPNTSITIKCVKK